MTTPEHWATITIEIPRQYDDGDDEKFDDDVFSLAVEISSVARRWGREKQPDVPFIEVGFDTGNPDLGSPDETPTPLQEPLAREPDSESNFGLPDQFPDPDEPAWFADPDEQWTLEVVPQPWYVRAWQWSGLDWAWCLILAVLLVIPAVVFWDWGFLALYVLLTASAIFGHRYNEHDRRKERLAWLKCPEHGPFCNGEKCCCADLHQSLNPSNPGESNV